MRRPSLRSQLNQIRLWVRQGRTDAWIAHKLDISVDQLRTFKRDQGLEDGESVGGSPPPADHASVDEVQEDESPVVEIEPDFSPASAFSAEEEPEPDDESAREDESEEVEWKAEAEPESDSERDGRSEEPARRRRRGRRGGRRRAGKAAGSFEATFDHGAEGYGLWLDPAVADNDVYSEHWAGHRAVSVTVEPDAITIRRVETGSSDDLDSD